MSKIKVEEILKKHNLIHVSKVLQMKAGDSGYDDRTLKAIKEIVELAIDKCAEEAKVERTNGVLKLPTEFVNKQSITNVKTMIDYE